jgi:hypothetical protein
MAPPSAVRSIEREIVGSCAMTRRNGLPSGASAVIAPSAKYEVPITGSSVNASNSASRGRAPCPAVMFRRSLVVVTALASSYSRITYTLPVVTVSVIVTQAEPFQ